VLAPGRRILRRHRLTRSHHAADWALRSATRSDHPGARSRPMSAHPPAIRLEVRGSPPAELPAPLVLLGGNSNESVEGRELAQAPSGQATHRDADARASQARTQDRLERLHRSGGSTTSPLTLSGGGIVRAIASFVIASSDLICARLVSPICRAISRTVSHKPPEPSRTPIQYVTPILSIIPVIDPNDLPVD